MIREELKLNIRKGLTSFNERDDDLIILIDDIYDDFESRTCENCIHYIGTVKSYGLNEGVCMNMPIGSTHAWRVKHDFGCNKFERKIDVNV